jgi:TolB-like protein/predicted Ser/Thr protein kinase
MQPLEYNRETMSAFATGIQVGPYQLLGSIGAGGMGEVWKARDTRLDRIVAIKRLKGEHNSRFQQEARAIAALNHPNICILHDVGPDYLVMEYLEGQPLKGPLPVEEAIPIAIQIAGAIEAAHGKGILHRDLKPANVMITATGAKLLDFGLARVMTTSDADTLTVAGTIAGTAAYMSPEQAQGKTLDERSDIFSFGAVLYEIISGTRAFAGDSMAQVLSAVLRDEPADLHSPAADIVKRCMSKDPAGRFQSMSEVKAALEQVSTKPAASQPSIAVLPFANMSADKENEYFSDGLAEEILNALAQIPGLKVIARTSSFAFRGKEQDITGIAETLRVKTILEGSVRRSGSRIRVTAQLIDAADGSHIWSERYDRELADVFAVQDEIAAAIAGTLRDKLGGERPAARQYKPSLAAYEAYLKGQYQLSKYTAEGISRSRQLFEQAIRLDPKYVKPRLALMSAALALVVEGVCAAREVVPAMRAAVHEILALDNANATALSMLGSIAAYYDYDWDEAAVRYRRAVAEAPGDYLIQLRQAIHYLDPVCGRRQDGLEASRKLVEQDPLSVFARAMQCQYLCVSGFYDQAASEARAALEIENHWLVHYIMAEAYAVREMFNDALVEAEEAYRLAPWQSRVMGMLAAVLTRLGRGNEAKEVLTKLESAPSFGMTLYHLLVGDLDAAAFWFQKSIEQREPFAVVYSPWPILKPLRESLHWPALAKMMNLPEQV